MRDGQRGSGWGERFAFIGFVFGLGLLVYLFGIATARYRLPPYGLVTSAIAAFKSNLTYEIERLPWQYFRDEDAPVDPDVVHDPARRAPGATLISGFTSDEEVHSVRVVDEAGEVIQEWSLRWSDVWPTDPSFIPEPVLSRDQQHLHGVALAKNGDIVFNFTELGTASVSPCGDIRWRVERRGHHSVDLAPDGTIWVPGIVTHYEPDERWPGYKPPFDEFTAIHLSADGEVLDEFSINDLLKENGFVGLLYLSTQNELTPIVSHDTLHVNDIDVFDGGMAEGVAKKGDLLISLRNINTIILVDPDIRKIRFISSGKVMRQHDVDFVDGNTISVFDNNNLLDEWFDNASGERGAQGQESAVVTISLETGEVLGRIDRAGGEPFFTDLMGAHQWLPNGNLLIVEARAGRVLERAPDGEVVWEYFNTVGEDLLGGVTYAQRLDPTFDADFFAAARGRCAGKTN